MTFYLADVKDTFEWTVKVRIPNKGSWREQNFVAEFHLLPQDRIDELIAKYRVLQEEAVDLEEDAPENLAAELLASWDETVRGTDGQPLPVTPENKAVLLRISYVRAAVVRAYFEAVGGRKAKLGN